MSELVEIATETERNRGNVVFVHGLDGDPITTWGGSNAHDPMFWPQWIAEEFPELAVLSLGFDAASTRLKGHAMGLVDRAGNILDLLMSHPAAVRLRERPTAFICHSLGGLVVKRVILEAVERRGSDSKIARFVDQGTQGAFLATPHEGAGLANVSKLFRIASMSTQDLDKGNELLDDLGQEYRELEKRHGIGLSHTVYFEQRDTELAKLGLLRIVDKASANPKLGDATPVAADANHFDICKPRSRTGREANVHLGVCRVLRNLAAGRVADTRVHRAIAAPAALEARKIVHDELRAPVLNFTGREAELAALDRQLWSGSRHAVTLTNRKLSLRGDAGVGKSALARQYAHLNANRYQGVWLIRAENHEDLTADLIA